MLAAIAKRPAARPFPPPPWLDSTLAPPSGSEPTRGWPLLATPVPADFPSPADDQVERQLSLDEHLIRNPESTFLLRVQGDALRELGVHDGDLLVIDRAAPPTTGSLVVAVVNGQFMLQHLGRDGQGRRMLRPARSDTATASAATLLTQEDEPDLTLWGVARWVIHRLWPGREP